MRAYSCVKTATLDSTMFWKAVFIVLELVGVLIMLSVVIIFYMAIRSALQVPFVPLHPASSGVANSFDWGSILQIVLALGLAFIAIIVIRWLLEYFQVGDWIQDARNARRLSGPYAHNLPGAAGTCRLDLSTVKLLIQADPARFCVLHDKGRHVVQRVLFNTKKNFPYVMLFDDNSRYNEHTRYNFTGCVYVMLSLRERKALAEFMRDSAFDSAGVQAVINEMQCCSNFNAITSEEVCKAKDTIAAAMAEQGEIYSRLGNRKVRLKRR